MDLAWQVRYEQQQREKELRQARKQKQPKLKAWQATSYYNPPLTQDMLDDFFR